MLILMYRRLVSSEVLRTLVHQRQAYTLTRFKANQSTQAEQVLEDLDFALERCAPILAELVGYGSTADTYHMIEPAPGDKGLVRTMGHALQSVWLCCEKVIYRNAPQLCHGNLSHQDIF